MDDKCQNHRHDIALISSTVITAQKDFLQTSLENYQRKQTNQQTKDRVKWNVEGDEWWKVSLKSYADTRL